MKALVLINEKSGTAHAMGADCVEEMVTAALARHGVEKAAVVTGEWRELVDAAQARPFDIAICAGGDGTQAAIAQTLLKRDAALLPLPCGTVNLLCRDLNLPLDIEAALEAGLGGRMRAIDAGVAGERVFLNNVVLGAYADLAEAREELRDAQSLDDLNFALVGAANALFHAEPVEFDIQVGRRKVSLTTNTIVLSNNAITSVEKLIPKRDRLDEGALSVYLAAARDGGDFRTVLSAFARGAADEDERIDVRRCKSCRISSPSAAFSYTVDGDVVERSEPLTVKILPKALRVFAPLRAAVKRSSSREQELSAGASVPSTPISAAKEASP